MAAGERCEAFKALEPSSELEARYFKNGANMSALSRFFASLQEDPASSWAKLEKNMAEEQERIKQRKMITQVLPPRDADETLRHTKWENNRDFMFARAKVCSADRQRARPACLAAWPPACARPRARPRLPASHHARAPLTSPPRFFCVRLPVIRPDPDLTPLLPRVCAAQNEVLPRRKTLDYLVQQATTE